MEIITASPTEETPVFRQEGNRLEFSLRKDCGIVSLTTETCRRFQTQMIINS